MLRQLLFVAYLVEAGLVLLIVPWSGLWERNAFIQMAATWIVDIARSGWARGAVSGIGLMLVGAGLAEAVSIRTPTRSAPSEPGGRPIVTLPRPCICLVTDRSRLPPPSPDAVTDPPALGPLAERLTLAGQAGVDLLQIREPDSVRRRAGRAGARGADAARGRGRSRAPASSSTSVSTSRSPPRRTAFTSSRIRFRRRWCAGTCQPRSWWAVPCTPSTKRGPPKPTGADYVIFGTVFPSGSKPRGHRTAGLDALAGVTQAVRVPVLAIGGISLNTVAAAAEAGAAGVAAIGLFFDAAGPMDDLRGRLIQTVAGLRLAFDRP